MYDTLIEGATIVDGTGRPAYVANVAIVAGTIALITSDRVRARDHIDARGMVLAPGFIDIHAHSEFYSGDMKIRQGITSELCGNCGIGCFPVHGNRKALEALCLDVLGRDDDWNWDDLSSFAAAKNEKGLYSNMMLLQAHSPLRVAAMGSDTDRVATDEEVARMCSLLDQSLSQGAAGFSTGLYYQPCVSADTRELEALLEVVRKHGKLFSVHVRSEGDGILESVREVIGLARKTGVRLEISHLKIIGERNQDKLEELLGMIHSAHDSGLDVAFDSYPYNYGSTSLFSLLPPRYLALSRPELGFALQLDGERRKMVEEMEKPEGWESIYSLVGPERIRILHMDSHSELDGKTLSELGDDPLSSLFDILCDERGAALMCDVTERQETLEAILRDPLMSFSTDALFSSFPVHERSHSASLRMIRTYCLDRKLFSLEECIRKMSGENASRLGLPDRGLVREGAVADLVLFDPERLDPDLPPDSDRGLDLVLVKGKAWGEKNGKVLLQKRRA